MIKVMIGTMKEKYFVCGGAKNGFYEKGERVALYQKDQKVIGNRPKNATVPNESVLVSDDEPHLVGKSDDEIIYCDEDGYYRILDIHMESNKINVGDKVMLKNYLQLYKIYNGVMMTRDMEDLKGKVLTVTTVESDEDDEDVLYMHLKECPNHYWYSDAMLEVIK